MYSSNTFSKAAVLPLLSLSFTTASPCKPQSSQDFTMTSPASFTSSIILGPTCGGPGTPCNTSNFQQVCCNSARFGTSACNLAGGNGFSGVCL
ncbi:hypothetical protein BFJ70_g460 [Fusarium oxysporum]|nr:hypothetical protein BFJ70_g460 [Fusarium oxysporum]